tara:strand:- start:393 stop:809 length:417 start_codon:yes stop_codon:yes gene_type:complete
MNESFKSKSFKFVFWIMLILLTVDTIDTIYRFIIIGYLGEGATFPGVNSIIKPDSTDLIIFLIFQIGIIYGIYLLYNLKKIGGYYFMFSQVLFLIYASIFGPISEIGISNILMPIILFFILYIILSILVPLLYSDKFK